MQFHPTNVAGAMVVTVDVHTDDRGLFARTFEEEAFAAAGLPTTWPQCSTSWNRKKGTLRGMHYQASPNPDPKLVRCTRGRIFDVALDIRRDSPTFLQWHGVELSQPERNALYIPPGCAHGFVTLEDDCEIFYMIGAVYAPELARGVRWDDPAFGIAWPIPPTLMSERDADYPDFQV